MRCGIVVTGFFIAGLASVIAWASIDARICSLYPRLCMPHAGECGGGLDARAVTAHTWLGLGLYLFAPPLFFSALGYLIARRTSRPFVMVKCTAIAVLVHWLFAFAGTRVLHI